jgi:hypothetical protein
MYSFLLDRERPRVDVQDFEWFTYSKSAPMVINANLKIEKGARFGVSPSSDRDRVNVVMSSNLSRVFSVSMEKAQRLAKGVRK